MPSGLRRRAWSRAFEERHEARLGPGRDLAHIAEWAAKLPGCVARIAGVLHVFAHPDGWEAPIDATTVDDAIQLGHYFSSQAVATFETMAADPLLDKARLLGQVDHGQDHLHKARGAQGAPGELPEESR